MKPSTDGVQNACDEVRDGRRTRVKALRLLTVLSLTMLVGCAAHREAPAAPDPLTHDLRLYAATEQFGAQVLASKSATATLEAWCKEHDLAPQAKIVAHAEAGADNPITAEQRADLQVSNDEPIKYRKVRLVCGERLLSEAENWYVPSRLTPEMNHQLETTTTPFGTVVKPLNPTRTTLRVASAWRVLPPGWEKQTDDALRQWVGAHADEATYREERTLFSLDAVLRRESDRLPISEVRENYKQGLLHFVEGAKENVAP